MEQAIIKAACAMAPVCVWHWGHWSCRGRRQRGGKSLEGMARQPEAAGTLRTNMIIGCAITETTGIYSLLIAFLILFAL